jgi:hypothetical protein
MAVVIAAAAAALRVKGIFKSITLDEAVKSTLIDGAASDTDITNYVDDMDHLSNAKMVGWDFGGRAITGMKASAVNASQNLVSAWMQLNFEQTDPINPDKTVRRSWSLPAYDDTLRGSDHQPTITTAGTGSLAARLGRVRDFLLDSLAFEAADGSIVVGGWTYVGGGFGTGADVIDGE